MIVSFDQLRAEELYQRFEHGEGLGESEKDELIRLLYRQMRFGQDDSKARLWVACGDIIRQAQDWGLRNLRQKLEHPAAGEAALLFLRFIDEFDGPETSFGAELLRRVRNGLTQARKDWGRLAKKEVPLTPEIADGLQCHAEARADEIDQVVREEVANLPHDERQIVELIYFHPDGLAIQEIAELLGITRQTVSARHRRAKSMLRKPLQSTWELLNS
ncbi:RNA polymerase sigma factor [Blastopirellula marina]|uniref:RNA polymerase sigma-70 region 4 domain-containing protein n=1 Tax=Blastopirellula marina TaxID=124 RepID=A0A2S8GQK9_9BACT|nr:sigma-70 family RNA polymerase sigma factor [Blastopirellula marina]PQO46720.1 hypothetical protein C5Y93_07755 [Blastopirellula marina]